MRKRIIIAGERWGPNGRWVGGGTQSKKGLTLLIHSRPADKWVGTYIFSEQILALSELYLENVAAAIEIKNKNRTKVPTTKS